MCIRRTVGFRTDVNTKRIDKVYHKQLTGRGLLLRCESVNESMYANCAKHSTLITCMFGACISTGVAMDFRRVSALVNVVSFSGMGSALVYKEAHGVLYPYVHQRILGGRFEDSAVIFSTFRTYAILEFGQLCAKKSLLPISIGAKFSGKF